MRFAGSRSIQDAPSTIGTSTAISAIITSATPSMPTENDRPMAGIQSTREENWYPDCSVTAPGT